MSKKNQTPAKTAPGTAYLNLDAVEPALREVVVKLGGKSHAMKPLTLRDFISNTQKIQNLQAGELDAVKEFELVSGMLRNAFPTLTEEDFGNLTMPQLLALMEFAQKESGPVMSDDDATGETKGDPR